MVTKRQIASWTFFKRLSAKEGAVCYGRAPIPRKLGPKVACITWISSGSFRYYAFKDRAQLAEFLKAVDRAEEIDLA